MQMNDFFELPENGGLRGKYETKYFHIYIYKDLPDIHFSEYEDSIKGTFMHEYLHYLQFVNTLFGISYGIAYNEYLFCMIDHFSKNDKVEIPLSILPENPKVDKLLKKIKGLKGTIPDSMDIDKIKIERSAIDLARSEGIAIKVEAINSANGQSTDFEFGYHGIIENMAIIFQSFFDENLTEHPAVPYHTVDLLLKDLKKPITDKKLIFSICLCSLMFSNPAVGFFDVIDILEANPGYNGIKLYKHILDSRIQQSPSRTIRELFLLRMDEYQHSIEKAIKDPLEYFSLVFENCKNEMQSKESFLLYLLYETEINSKEAITELVHFYGLPIVEGNNLTLMPRNPKNGGKTYLDMANLRALEIVANRFTSPNRRCQLYEKCSSYLYRDDIENKFEMSKECEDEQWMKKEVCLMSLSMRKYKIDKKNIIQNTY